MSTGVRPAAGSALPGLLYGLGRLGQADFPVDGNQQAPRREAFADVYPIDRVRDAHTRLAAGGVRGRLVLVF